MEILFHLSVHLRGLTFISKIIFFLLSFQQHIAASKGHEHCVVLLLEYGADPNIKGIIWAFYTLYEFEHVNISTYLIINYSLSDSEGSVPLWEAILGKHKSVVKVLAENGATISSGDVGRFACTAIEQNNLDFLSDIVHYGGDVTQLTSNGTTALHTAISEGNVEIVKFLVDQGADIDRPDIHGWTARGLADHQGHEDILIMLQTKQETNKPPVFSNPKQQQMPGKHIVKYSSDSSIPPYAPEIVPPVPDIKWSNSHRRRRPNTFHNSLFGIMSAANTGEHASEFLMIILELGF